MRKYIIVCSYYCFNTEIDFVCMILKVGGDVETINKYYLTENYDVPCNSIKLRDTLPLISEIVRNIPQYKAVENCQEAFNIAATYIPIRNKIFEKNNDYLYTTVKQIAENGHITLVCPDITSDSDVQWFKDNTLLVSLYRQVFQSLIF